MLVRKWMTQDPVTVTPDTHVVEAFRIFREYEFRHLPVLKDDVLVGIVTDHDLGKRILDKLASGGPEDLGTIGDVMSRKVVSVGPDEPVSQAALIMHNEKFGGLPVVEDGKLVGILTINDLLEILMAKLG